MCQSLRDVDNREPARQPASGSSYVYMYLWRRLLPRGRRGVEHLLLRGGARRGGMLLLRLLLHGVVRRLVVGRHGPRGRPAEGQAVAGVCVFVLKW